MNSKSTLCMHVGQCGVQLGAEFWRYSLPTHARCAYHDDLSPLVHYMPTQGKQQLTMNAIVVDAEPKVVNEFEDMFHQYRPSIIHGQSGMGNCWPSGYFCNSSEKRRLMEDTIECLRQRLEAIPASSLLFTCSLSGGTGSGVTSALLQHCADAYPSITRVVAGILPFETSDNPLKHYNTILSAQYFYEYADAVLLRSNDLLFRETSALLGVFETGGFNRDVLRQMNQVMAQDLMPLFHPQYVSSETTLGSLESREFPPYYAPLEDIVSDVCVGKGIGNASISSHSSMKILRSGATPRKKTVKVKYSTADTANTVQRVCTQLGTALGHVNQHLRTCQSVVKTWKPYRMQVRTAACPITDQQCVQSLNRALKKFQPMVRLPFESRITQLEYKCTRDTAPAIGVVTHAPWTAAELRRHAIRAEEMLKVRAFIHWYEREGCSEMDVHSALSAVQVQLQDAMHRY